ncbi:long-chain fatty acid--CoA ligase [Nocardia sp. CDC159]|uniref:Acyl-CoA synthetase n=1 Tax=Nocardia pulmonis TaxID=2951408 RepID=A0A9X2E8E8_9NOCA|nr:MULTISPECIES: long-chain fatty acid--CoA ligase [Nocardia]MCM6775490.1 long-chain fatty acid--CoA ligase [Nocardia pulmonis]MCM6787776.1 long-chain fatty acid--CoA ligase [Nocardia sp. CDC159]
MCEAFQNNVSRNPDLVALRTRGDTQRITWREYGNRVRAIATGLAALGVRRGDTVALMLTNRPEFHLCDTAVLHTGATPFSVYNTNPVDLLAYQFGNAEPRLVICESQFVPQILAAVEKAAAQGHRIERVICVDGTPEGTVALTDVETTEAPDFDFESAWRAVDPEDLLTIVYTSGTTGPPKGVELTHTNFIENARIVDEFGGGSPEDRVVSYLPDAHAANRWFAHYLNLLEGGQITTVADLKQVAEALTEVRPTVFLGVPRIWVKVKAALEEKLAAEPSSARRALAEWAIATGRARARAVSDGRPQGVLDRLRYALADRLVLSTIRARLGLDQVRVGVTGSAPIPRDTHEFFLGLGLPLCEGYGMTECTAGATVTRPERIKIGTVGTPLPGAEVKIAEDGEVLVRGRMVMRGYRKDPEKTADTVDSDGWLHTGDIGEIDDEGYLRIVDRKKELIINAAGKNMSPTNIENTITEHTPLAGTVAVIGEGRPYNTALICLDPDLAAAFAERNELPGDDIAALAANPLVRASIEDGVAAANAKLSRVEQVRKFAVLPDVWAPGSDCLTATGKLRRKPIAAAYADTIESLYAT